MNLPPNDDAALIAASNLAVGLYDEDSPLGWWVKRNEARDAVLAEIERRWRESEKSTAPSAESSLDSR